MIFRVVFQRLLTLVKRLAERLFKALENVFRSVASTAFRFFRMRANADESNARSNAQTLIQVIRATQGPAFLTRTCAALKLAAPWCSRMLDPACAVKREAGSKVRPNCANLRCPRNGKRPQRKLQAGSTRNVRSLQSSFMAFHYLK